ncbi:GNAT family N-acetyltransferase [Chlorogloeopsis fritschii PCC 9212]|nr:hypothetical protein [Chlorogloeopsis fritschii]
MKEVVIRTASLDDAPALAHLMSQLGYSTSADEMKERLKGILSTASYMTFVAEIRGEVVGMVGMGIIDFEVLSFNKS